MDNVGTPIATAVRNKRVQGVLLDAGMNIDGKVDVLMICLNLNQERYFWLQLLTREL